MERFLTDQQMRPIQLGADVHGKIEGAHGPVHCAGSGSAYGEIAAETNECLGPSFDDLPASRPRRHGRARAEV